jgi:hypothetical protein
LPLRTKDCTDGTTIGFVAGVPIDARAGFADGPAAGAVSGVVAGDAQSCAGACSPHIVAGSDDTAVGVVAGIATKAAAGSAEGTALGAAFGVGGALCAAPSNSRGLVATLAGTDGIAIGYLKGLVRPDVKLWEGATEDGSG